MGKKLKSGAFLGMTLLAMCSCGGKTSAQPGVQATDSVASVDTVLATDSVVCYKKMGDNMECKIVADYPSGDDSLSHRVVAYINGELGRQYLPAMNDMDNAGKYPLYTGTKTDGKTVATYYAEGTLRYFGEQASELKEAGMEEEPSLTFELAVRKTADNARYASYTTTSYAFLGGAHGSASSYTVNIAKPSGTVLTQTVDTLKAKAMQPILRKGVVSYLRAQGEDGVTEKTLGDILFIENGIVPLPAHAPYLAADGVHFVYQQYEIGPYAMGMVEFTVPYGEIRPYLTKEALALVK